MIADRYISEKALIENVAKIEDLRTLSTKTIGEAISKTPTADVVPRAELDAMRGAANSYKMHYENTRSEVAREICCEIEEEIVAALESNYRVLANYDDGRCNEYILELVNRVKGKVNALRGIEGFVEELKKKYTEGE